MQLVGIILPPVIDLVNRFIPDRTFRFLVAFLICAIIGVLLLVAQGVEIGYSNVLESILAVFGASQLSYTPVYSGSRVQKLIRK